MNSTKKEIHKNYELKGEIKALQKELLKANEENMVKIMKDIEKKSNQLYKSNMSSLSERKSDSKKDYSIKELQDILDKYCKVTPKISSKKTTPKAKSPTPIRRSPSEEMKEEYERKSQTPPKPKTKTPPKPKTKTPPKIEPKPVIQARRTTPTDNEKKLLEEILQKEGLSKCDKKLTVKKMTEVFRKYKDDQRYQDVLLGFSMRKKKADKCKFLGIPL